MAHLWLAATSENMYFSSLGESTMLHHRFPYVFLVFLPLAMEFLEECTKLHGYRNRRCINISEFTLNLRVAIWNFLLPSQKWLTSTSTDGTILLKLMTGVVKSVLFLHPWAKDVQQLFHICEPRIWFQPSTARVPTMRRSWRSIAKLLGENGCYAFGLQNSLECVICMTSDEVLRNLQGKSIGIGYP